MMWRIPLVRRLQLAIRLLPAFVVIGGQTKALMGGDDAPSLRVTVRPVGDSVLPGENFPLRVTIMNVGDVTLWIPDLGYEYPRIEMGADGEEARKIDRVGGLHSGSDFSPVLEPRESITFDIFMFPGMGRVAFLKETEGRIVKLRAIGTIPAFRIEEDQVRKVDVALSSEQVPICVRVQTIQEERARRELAEWFENQAPELARQGASEEELDIANIQFFGGFLGKYPNTPYAAAVSLFLAERLDRVLGRHKENPPQEWISLFTTSVERCMECGPVYIAALGRGPLERLAMHGRWDLCVRAISVLADSDADNRTTDLLLMRIVGELTDLDRLRSKMALPTAEAKNLESVLMKCIARFLSWEGYRVAPLDRRLLHLLESAENWDQLESASRYTLRAIDLWESVPQPVTRPSFREEAKTAAESGLELARQKRQR